MDKLVKVRDLIIGDGIPKICVPIIGKTREEVLEVAKSLSDINYDFVEWRVDWLDNPLDLPYITEILKELRSILNNVPILFTFRTAIEGGEEEITKEDYYKLNYGIIISGLVDMIDVELFMGDELVTATIEEAHAHGIKVVVSNHDFERTPAKKEIVNRLQRMQSLGADLPKIAVMPVDKTDVLTLLAATEEMASTYSSTPIITMAMGRNGVISRICGEFFGSAVTFGSASHASAPGQIPANELSNIITKMHEFF
ncbi:3-dehydroquinate dehydratase [Pseudobutyrivibrio sp. YE44]|uniref:type I 3-dehydroquinate dehydratase n=1 Tax=Pseudobutyrivibrio sp. YE44 TaxID=1520802 RepID=UPI000882D454|nr:type I 3-dehydroquinate dehydratase [Pseudobutyrivibrio sp. YE44]SDB04465.1 3-dehydroquinate dehydratase [Pseudobutyrivibrio sp. YE44]